MKKKNILSKLPHHHKKIAIFITLFFSICYLLLVLHKYWQFEYFFVDNVYFHSALWKVSRGEIPMVRHQHFGIINILGDHFHPIIFSLSVILKLIPKNEVVLSSMVILYSISSLLAYKVGFKLIKNKWLVHALMISYWTYLGTQNAFMFGFHEINFMPPIFFTIVYASIFKKNWLYWMGAFLLLLIKETMPIILIFLSLSLFLLKFINKKTLNITLILSAIYFVSVTSFIIPNIAGKFFYQKPVLPRRPHEFVNTFFKPIQKIEAPAISLLSFAFLPILNLPTLPLLLQDYLSRVLFAIPGNIQYSLGFHYNIALAPMLLFSSFISLTKIQEKTKFKKLQTLSVISIIFISILLNRFYTQKGPIIQVFIKDFYKNTQNNQFLWDFIKKAPNDGLIMTQNHLGLPLSDRDIIRFKHPLVEVVAYDPEYLIYDLREGQNPNNFFPTDESGFTNTVNELISEGRYTIIYNQSDQYILQKNNRFP